MASRPRVFEYAVTLDDAWTAASDRGGASLPNDEDAWTPEHLLLAALGRCSLTSFRYHARRASLESTASAEVHGVVTRREQDGRFALVEVDVDARVALEPEPDEETVRALVAKGERDCYVGASLTVAPRYRWTVNGNEIA